MNLTIPSDKLRQSLRTVLPTISSRATLPILSNVAISAKDDRLSLFATNLDIFISHHVDASVKKAGAITVPAAKLNSLVNELSCDQLSLSLDKQGVLKVTAPASVYQFNGLDYKEFPPMPELKGDDVASFELKQSDLSMLLHLAGFCISTDESRYVLNGVHLEIDKDLLCAVTTDGRRLALVGHQLLEDDAPQKLDLIIPAEAISVLAKLLPKPAKPNTDGKETDEALVTIRCNDRAIVFDLGHTVMHSKLIEGNFPNYRQVIPDDEGRKPFNIGRADLIAALHRVGLFSENATLTLLPMSVTVASHGDQTNGAGHESIMCGTGVKKDVSIAFRGSYMLDALAALDSDEVTLRIKDELTPIVMTCPTRPTFKYILMPVRLAGDSEAKEAPKPEATPATKPADKAKA